MIKPEKSDEFLCWCDDWNDRETAELVMLVDSAQEAVEKYAEAMFPHCDYFEYLEAVYAEDCNGIICKFGVEVEMTPYFHATEIKKKGVENAN